MSIETVIQRLATALQNTRSALARKGISAGSHGFEDIADDIDDISVGIDISDTTAIASDVKSNKIFYRSNGTRTTGTFSGQNKSATPSTTQQEITPDSGKYLEKVTVKAIQAQTKTATPSTTQQEITPDSGKFLSKVTVNAIQTQTKFATPAVDSQNILPDSGKYLSKVTVNKIPNQQSGGTKYVSAQDQTLVSAPKYITSDIILKGISQTNLLAKNIKSGVTVKINNGSTDVFSVTGEHSNNNFEVIIATSGGSSKRTFESCVFSGTSSEQYYYYVTVPDNFRCTRAMAVATGDDCFVSAFYDFSTKRVYHNFANVSGYNFEIDNSWCTSMGTNYAEHGAVIYLPNNTQPQSNPTFILVGYEI